MHANRHMPNHFVFALLASFLAGTGAASAEQQCFPHCDYTHYYGPFDFTYVQPGLFGYPHCGPQGDCSPHLSYTTGIVQPQITVRFPRVMAVRPSGASRPARSPGRLP